MEKADVVDLRLRRQDLRVKHLAEVRQRAEALVEGGQEELAEQIVLEAFGADFGNRVLEDIYGERPWWWED
jgi:hypothetical protein